MHFMHAAVPVQVTYKRLQDTLSVLTQPSSAREQLPGLALLDVMFGARQPQFAAAAPNWKANNTRLDESQVRCSQQPVTVLQLPGTVLPGFVVHVPFTASIWDPGGNSQWLRCT
jgi:hypothetical protein